MNANPTLPRRAAPLTLGIVPLLGVLLLLIRDVDPRLFPAPSHAYLGAFPLATIAIAYLVFQASRRAPAIEWAKATLLAAAFLFWAANQFWPGAPLAGLFNDIAVALFVLDLFLVMAFSNG